MSEEWRVVDGWGSVYEVSDRGRVRSWGVVGKNRKDGTRGRANQPRVLQQQVNAAGYCVVTLRNPGRRRVVSVHVLVAGVFVGARPTGAVIRHLDGQCANNQASNLAYGTPSENVRDEVAHGTHWLAKRTRCQHGHPFSGDNLVVRRDGRECRACKRAYLHLFRAMSPEQRAQRKRAGLAVVDLAAHFASERAA